MAAKLFISYRRDDSAGYAGRVHDRLEREYGSDLLFMDVDSIPLGVNFIKVLQEEVAKCEVLLAVIGPNWLSSQDEDGHRRLDDPNDFVRIEIATALQRGMPVIPILLDGAKIPRVSELPEDLQELSVRNGLQVRHASFHSDIDKLVHGLNAKRHHQDDEAKRRAEAQRKEAEAETLVVERQRGEDALAKQRADEEARRKTQEAEALRLAEDRRQAGADAKRRADEEHRRKQEEAEARQRAENERRAREAEAKQRADQEQAFEAVKRTHTVDAVDEFLVAHRGLGLKMALGMLRTRLVEREEAYRDTRKAALDRVQELAPTALHLDEGGDQLPVAAVQPIGHRLALRVNAVAIGALLVSRKPSGRRRNARDARP
jgi:flagellar biosynthesis GTPase FlhF